jgi:arginase family enzyme
MLYELFIPPEELEAIQLLPNRAGTLGHSIKKGISALDSGDVKLAIVGIPESRGSACEDFAESPNVIRSMLYGLSEIDSSIKICDLGNVKQGKKIEDTYAAIEVIAEELIERDISILVIGGSQDLTIPLVDGFGKKPGNLVVIDDRLDYSADLDYIKDEQFINYINPSSQISLLAGQSFFINKNTIEQAITKHDGEIVMLGELRDDIKECGPLLRGADVVSFDMSALKENEAFGQYRNSPSGLFGEEACQLAWYAGLRHIRNIFAFFGYSPLHDPTCNGAMLSAQIAWYYIKGVASRKNDSPFSKYSDFKQFHVPVEGIDEAILFLKHKSTDRWWMEISSRINEKTESKLIPCTEKDYLIACANELPDRWLRSIISSLHDS